MLTWATSQVITEAIACNSKAEIGFDAKKGKLNEIIGNQTEGALVSFPLTQSIRCISSP